MSDPGQMPRDLMGAGAKISPAIAVSAATIGGLSLQEWVFVATLLYIVLQAAHLTWKWFREWRAAQVTPAVRTPQDE